MRFFILIALFLGLSVVGYSSESEKSSNSLVELIKAAEQGYADAQNSLGQLYAEGEGVLQDYVLAHKWFNIASSLGRESARELRKELEARMTPDQIAEAQKLAREWIANRKQQGE